MMTTTPLLDGAAMEAIEPRLPCESRSELKAERTEGRERGPSQPWSLTGAHPLQRNDDTSHSPGPRLLH